MDISKLKISVGLVVALLMQGGGFVWFISELNSQVNHNTIQIELLLEQAEENAELIDDLESKIKVIENEMRTIMADHDGFGEVLQQLNQSGLLPSGEKRKYGNYE